MAVTEQEFQRLLNAELPLVLKRDWRRFVALGAVALALLLAVMVMWPSPLLVTAALCATVYFCFKLRFSSPIMLDARQFTIARKQVVAWEDASRFRVVYRHDLGPMAEVVSEEEMHKQNIKPAACRVGFSQAWINKIDGSKVIDERGLRMLGNPKLYGLTAFQLAQFMNHWRERALRDNTKS